MGDGWENQIQNNLGKHSFLIALVDHCDALKKLFISPFPSVLTVTKHDVKKTVL